VSRGVWFNIRMHQDVSFKQQLVHATIVSEKSSFGHWQQRAPRRHRCIRIVTDVFRVLDVFEASSRKNSINTLSEADQMCERRKLHVRELSHIVASKCCWRRDSLDSLC